MMVRNGGGVGGVLYMKVYRCYGGEAVATPSFVCVCQSFDMSVAETIQAG